MTASSANRLPPSGKWVQGVFGDTPALLAAGRVLARRLRAVGRLLPLAARHADEDPEYVHQLRVATRRCAAAVRVFRDWTPKGRRRRMRETLRAIREAATDARRDDVHLAILREVAGRVPGAPSTGLDPICERVRESRAKAQRAVRRLARGGRVRDFRALRRGLLDELRAPRPAGESTSPTDQTQAPYTMSELAARELPELLKDVREAGQSDLHDLEQLHGLRIAGKKLRYALEVFAGCFPPSFREHFYPRLAEMQERLGEINDYHEIVLRIESMIARRPAEGDPKPPADGIDVEALSAWADVYRSLRDRHHRAFQERWSSGSVTSFLDELTALVNTPCGPRSARPRRPALRRGTRQRARAENGDGPAGNGGNHLRVAAIDVGTNSVRLVVAESDPVGKFRVIEDVRETTRLGGGLTQTGRLDRAAVEASVATLAHMKSLADEYRVARLRAVGTSAVREATNAEEFLDLVRRRAGVNIEVIDPEYEARLAFSSVVNAFDLDDRRFAAVDLGGGSTELVLSSSGLIDGIYQLPLGAVRLTDRFADPARPGAYLYQQMCTAVDRIIQERVGAPPHPLELMVGTGGTFTSLARIAIRRGTGGGEGRFPFAIRGYELSLGQVSELLGSLRDLPLEQRRRLPGLGERRAEIMVAGVCVIERLMRHLDVNRLWVHDGGIRDGLLSEMMDELGWVTARGPGSARAALGQVRAFAQRSGYEQKHSEHVTALALRIFDQLAAQVPDAAAAWGSLEARDLLHAAGVLHDVGIAIEYARHHKHSHDMIRHADLSLLSRHEVEIVANIARYHRRRGPSLRHTGYHRLGDDDRRLVAHLAGILRIADGLDRLHTQNVRDVQVLAEPGRVRFAVLADDDFETSVCHARRKADVFESAFHCAAEFARCKDRAPHGRRRAPRSDAAVAEAGS
jgi:exopolyphosphatase/guanosine-5'-triphosphate,3'-diphosphate pyrophosphatase